MLTNRQVWLIDHGLVFGVRTSTIPLEKINQVSYQRHMFFGDVEITNGADVTELRNVEKNSAQHFVQFINDYLANLYHEDHYQQSGIVIIILVLGFRSMGLKCVQINITIGGRRKVVSRSKVSMDG